MADETRPVVSPPPQVIIAPRRGGFLKTLVALALLGVIVAVVFFAGMVAGVAAGLIDDGGITTYQKGEGEEKVAILPISGVIEGSTVGFVHDAVESIIKDKNIKAVILRIESPGGGATASDEILRHIQRLKTERSLPVIASYGDYAASGGYYVSCQADIIIAQPTCITGSIGVIAPYMTIERLLNEKLGITPEVVTSTDAVNKDTGSFLRAWTDKDRTEIRHLLDAVQDQFVSVVAEGRKGKLTAGEVKTIATGAPFMARDALKAKLVDKIGYLDDAIAEAVERGEIKQAKPPVIMYTRRASLLSELGASTSVHGLSAQGFTLDVTTLKRWAMELAAPQRMMMVQP